MKDVFEIYWHKGCGIRQTVSLNGLWQAQQAPFDQPPEQLPEHFDNRIPVPGFWDMAEKEITMDAVWYQKELVFDGPLPEHVFLKIHKAFWGKYIYVNGQHAADHQPNFTPAYVDIRAYLKGEGQVNTLLIKIGAKGTQDKSLGHAVGYDPEKFQYIPGIYDNVELLLNDGIVIRYVQAAPDVANQSVGIYATLFNPGRDAVTVDAAFCIRGWKDRREVRSCRRTVTLEAGQTMTVQEQIPVPDCHLWTPEDPYLYEISVEAGGDSLTQRFGMREFQFREGCAHPFLNGKPYYLRGSNITMYRFFEDPDRGGLPFDREWARKILLNFKELHMNSLRYCIGFPPELWYELADEIGLLIDDEYPMWRELQNCGGQYPDWGEHVPEMYDTLMGELNDWINERANHPSVVIWDLQNETVTFQTGVMIHKLREANVDKSNRPFDNGWAPPVNRSDSIECHPYPFADEHFRIGMLNGYPTDPAVFHPQFFNYSRVLEPSLLPDNPRMLNEYGWLWINRDGTPTTLTQKLYDARLPGVTGAQRQRYYARHVAMLTEFWRAGRKAAGVLHFCGLTYCKKDVGCTCDSLLPDIRDPRYEPHFVEEMKSAMAPVGVCIGDFREEQQAGERAFPVSVINDGDVLFRQEVTLTLWDGERELSRATLPFCVPCAGKQVQEFAVCLPAGKHLAMEAAYVTPQGERVRSRREFTVQS